MAQTVTGTPVSLISCSRDRSGKMGSISVDQENAVAGKFEVTYTIQMADQCGPITVLQQGQAVSPPNNVPVKWSTYSYLADSDDKSYVKSFDINRDPKKASLFYVTVHYEPLQPGEQPDGGGAPILATVDPLARKPVFWWDRELSTKLHTVDKDGNALKNFANGLYSDLVETEHTKSIQIVEFNVATVADVNDYIVRYDDSVNLNDWTFKGTLYKPRTVNIREVTGSPTHTEGSSSFHTLTMRIAFAPLGQVWDVKLPEVGQSYFTKTSGTYDVDSQGFRKRGNAGSLVPLESDGTRRADTSPILTTAWRVAREVDYSPLLTIFNR